MTRTCPKCGKEFLLRNSTQAYCPPCHNAYRKGRYKLSPEEKRSRNYKQNYGITEETYQRMFEQQGGVCAACGLPENRMNARLKGRLHVDHDHVTGQVRGLLCANCNAALGLLRDEPQRIEALLAYRLHWKQALKDAHERLRELEAALNALNDELDYHHEREALAEQGEE